jgi:hypothetical protein
MLRASRCDRYLVYGAGYITASIGQLAYSRPGIRSGALAASGQIRTLYLRDPVFIFSNENIGKYLSDLMVNATFNYFIK